MTTIGTALNLVDFARSLDPNGNTADIVELLSQTNDVIDDVKWVEGNLPTGHLTTMRTGLPSSTWRKLNQGIPNSKSTKVQVTETCGMLTQRGQIDKKIAQFSGDPGKFRLTENKAHLEAMNQDFVKTLFYGDHTANPEQFLGLSGRYTTVNPSTAANAANVINGNGSGSGMTSIWLIGWGEHSVHGIFPKGTKAGLTHTPIMDATGDGCSEARDSSGNSFRAFVDEFEWDCGIALKDWRYVVRIANIDISNLVAESSAANLIKLMSRAIDCLPSLDGVTPAFYANRTIFSQLRVQALNASQNALSVESALNQFGKSRKQLMFQEIPIRKVDQLLKTETSLS